MLSIIASHFTNDTIFAKTAAPQKSDANSFFNQRPTQMDSQPLFNKDLLKPQEEKKDNTLDEDSIIPDFLKDNWNL